MVGQPVPPHSACLPPHNGHPSFSPATPHPAHMQYPGFPHALHPTSMTLVQNPQAMVHQPGAPPLAGNLGLDIAAMVPGSQVGAFQQNQLGHLGWAPQSFWRFWHLPWCDYWKNFGSISRETCIECCNMLDNLMNARFFGLIINGETTFWSALLIQKMSLASSGILDSFSFFKILTLSMVACTCTSFLLVLVVDRR